MEQNQFPRFNTIMELVDAHYQQGGYNDVINSVLLCLTQFGYFIRYVETDPDVYPSKNTIYIGLSTGLITASTIACSKSLHHLLEIAIDAVCVCFRAGFEAKHRAKQLERDADMKSTWSVCVSDVSSSEMKSSIDTIHQKRNIVPSKHAYISMESISSTTISGPPSTLKFIFSESQTLAKFKNNPVSIRSIYHASHLGAVDTESIVGDQEHFNNYSVNGRVHSTRDGTCFPDTTNFHDLLTESIKDLLFEPLRWNQVVSEVISYFTSIQCTEINIVPFGSTNIPKDLIKSLNEAGIAANIKSSDKSKSTYSNIYGKEAVAIVGIGGRLPGGDSLEEFWKSLVNGVDTHKMVPSDRFDIKTHYDPTGAVKNSTLSPYGCFIDHPGLFDATLFNMTPREATQTDPQHRMALMTTYEALEMAGYVPDRTPSTASHRIGTFFGQTSDDWREVNTGQNVDTFYITGGIRAFAPGRLNYYFKWEGPSFSVDTACSSSSSAVHFAYSALLNHECDTAIAGGLSLLTAPDPFAGLSRASFLSKTGSCKTFDDDADGYCRGDGVGCIIMKRFEDAVADNDNILGMILGVATNHSADAVSITHPHSGTQERLFRSLLNNATFHPNDIDYVELHGTGTQAGDACETLAVTNVFANNRRPEIPLYIGSVKANVGHGEGASGVTAIIKVVMMLQNNVIPPHVGIKNRLNTKLPPLDALNVRIVRNLTEFKPRMGQSKRRIVINNFDAAGGNTSILMEDPPRRTIQGVDPRSVHIVAVSAKTPFSFKANAERLLTYIKQYPQSSLGDISYTTTARRMHHIFREAFAVSSITELETSLKKIINATTSPIRTSPTKVVFVFTGQGSHYLKMGKDLFDHCSTFRKNILEYDNICRRQNLPSFKALIDGSAESLEVLSPIQIELALISTELALANLCISLGIKPGLVIGHSHGEYAALCTSGVLSVNDAIYLVGKRASLMAAKCNPGTYAMLAVMRDANSVKNDLLENESLCEIACFNSHQSTVISGCVPDIVAMKTYYNSQDVKTVQLAIPFAFHSSQLDAIREEYRVVTEGVTFSKPVIPIASTLLARVVQEDGVFAAEHLCRHARESVKFLQTIEECKRTGIIDDRTVWLEMGPHPVCMGMVKAILKLPAYLTLPTLKKEESSLVTIANSISKVYTAGVDINWMAYQKEYESAHRLLPLPTYAFDLKNYWIQYEGDWCLRKNAALPAESVQTSAPTFTGTTTLQQIKSEKFESSGASVVFITDFSDPTLLHAVQGHVVNGVAFAPCSILGDMALTAAKYIYNRCNNCKTTPPMDVLHMDATQPLTERDCINKKFIYLSATRDTNSDTVDVTISSEEGSIKTIYATCLVQYGKSTEWIAEWNRYSYLMENRMNELVKGAESGKSYRLPKNIAYKIFSALVRYAEKYRVIEDAWLDSNTLEAAANIKFQTTTEDGSFEYSPYWVDGIAHMTGFVLTSACNTDPDFTYTSNGWKSLRLLGHLSADKMYRGYVHMQSVNDKNILSGDVYLFEESKIVAVCCGIKFHLIRRAVLEYLLPSNVEKSHARMPLTIADNKTSSSSHAISTTTTESDAISFDEILNIIASETGVEMIELNDEINLTDLGVDSLLTISILARIHHLTKMNVPTSLFQTHPTVGDLRNFYNAKQSSDSKIINESSKSSDSEHSIPRKASMTHSIPRKASMTHSIVANSSPSVDMVDIIRSIIASETGCEESNILPSTVFGDLQVDNIKSLSIVNTIRLKTGMDIPADFFDRHHTFSDVLKQIGITPTIPRSHSISKHKTEVVSARKQSTSIFLQGTSTSLPPLFLLPDGSGSASSYVPLPVFDNDMIVYSLNSPFLNCPLEFTCPVEEVATMYLNEIRNRQPFGPYLLGGWSAGGILAYETATQLLALGEEVLGLIFIDSPCPVTLPPFPFEYIDFLDSIGIFDNFHKGSISIPGLIKDHFKVCITAVMRYKPKLIDPLKAPIAVAIWAKEGVLESVSCENIEIPKDENPNSLKGWLLESRRDYGPGGWEYLLPSVECLVIPGNHFTIMRQPHVVNLAKAIEQAVTKITKNVRL